MREKLKDGSFLRLKNNDTTKEYYIESCVGEGASCIVYDALFTDDIGIMRKVRIKELFPINLCNTNRDENKLVWKNEDAKAKAFKDFENVYKRHIYFQNMNKVANSTSIITDTLLQANDTLYFVLDCASGNTYDKIKPMILQEVFDVALTLTKFAQKYHEQGYILMDIKPENFYCIDETRELIKYLDYDSVVNKIQLMTHKDNLSYSPLWAAPELLQLDVNNISNKTDLYSIGAIVYNKIFNKKITSQERSLGFVPNYSNMIYKDILDPVIYKKMTQFFNKTLCNNPKRRYEDAQEMIEDLKELINLSDINRIYLLDSAIDQRISFKGREEEINIIDKAFDEGKRIVVINGCGGIGKTELAKQYALTRKNRFNKVILGKYENGLTEFFNSTKIFQIANYNDEENTNDRYQIIKGLIDEETLLIVDNLDILEDERINDLLSMPCKIIITTREYVNGMFVDSETMKIVKLNIMEIKDLLEIFYTYYLKAIDEHEKEYVEKIIEISGGLSLIVPILAKQMQSDDILPSKMYEMLSDSSIKKVSKTLVKHFKDNNIINDTVYNQVARTFNVLELNEQEKRVLYMINLLGNSKVDKRTLALFSGLFVPKYIFYTGHIFDFTELLSKASEKADITIVNSLIEKGYLEYDPRYNSVSCHNILRELANYELHYTIDDLPEFRDLLDKVIEQLCYEEVGDEWCDLLNVCNYEFECMNPSLAEDFGEIIANVLANLDYTKAKNRKFIFDRGIRIGLISYSDFANIIKKIEKQINLTNLKEKDYINYNIMKVSGCLLKRWSGENKSVDLILKALKDIDKYLDVEEINQAKVVMAQFATLFSELVLYARESKDITKAILQMVNKIEDIVDRIDEKPYDRLTEEERAVLFCVKLDTVISNLNEKLNEPERKNTIFSYELEEDEEEIENNINLDIYDEFFENLISDKIIPSMKHALCLDRNIYKYADFVNTNKDKEFKYTPRRELINKDIIIGNLIRNAEGKWSIGRDIDLDILDYLVLGNDFMALDLLFLILYIYNRRREYKLDSIYNVNGIHPTTRSIDVILERVYNDPYFAIQMLKLKAKNVYTKENKIITDDIFGAHNLNSSINSFIVDCSVYGNKYDDEELKVIAMQQSKDSVGINVTYDHDFLFEYKAMDSHKLWEEVYRLYEKISGCTDEEVENVKEEIINNIYISPFYKEKLLNCEKVKLSIYDLINWTCFADIGRLVVDEKLLQESLDKEASGNLDRLDYLFVLGEILWQSFVKGDEDKIQEYGEKIVDYLKDKHLYNGKLDYILFNSVFMIIDAINKCYSSEVLYQLMAYLLKVWLYPNLDKMNYYIVDIINNSVDTMYNRLKDVVLEKNDLDELYNSYKNVAEYIRKIQIPDDHLFIHSDRLEGQYTEEKDAEYLRRCNDLIDRWKDENHSKDEYLAKYQEYFDEIYPEELEEE